MLSECFKSSWSVLSESELKGWRMTALDTHCDFLSKISLSFPKWCPDVNSNGQHKSLSFILIGRQIVECWVSQRSQGFWYKQNDPPLWRFFSQPNHKSPLLGSLVEVKTGDQGGQLLLNLYVGWYPMMLPNQEQMSIGSQFHLTAGTLRLRGRPRKDLKASSYI